MYFEQPGNGYTVPPCESLIFHRIKQQRHRKTHEHHIIKAKEKEMGDASIQKDHDLF